MIAVVHGTKDFVKELADNLVAEMVLVPIRIYVDALSGRTTMTETAWTIFHVFVIVSDEVQRARLDVEHKCRVVANSERTLDAVTLQDSLDRGSDASLLVLVHVSHLESPVSSTYIPIISNIPSIVKAHP